jgi:hypothetical protein
MKAACTNSEALLAEKELLLRKIEAKKSPPLEYKKKATT